MLAWLLLALLCVFLALETTRDDAQVQLQLQAEKQADEVSRNILLLQQQLALLAHSQQGASASMINTWVPSIILQRFPALERVAVLDTSQQQLRVEYIVPMRLAGDILPQQDLSGQRGYQGVVASLRQGRQHLLDASLIPGESRLLWLYPFPGQRTALAIWFYPQRWLEGNGERGISLYLRQGQALAGWRGVADIWRAPLIARDFILIGGQRYQLELQRPLQYSDFDLLRWIPLVLFLLLLAVLLLRRPVLVLWRGAR